MHKNQGETVLGFDAKKAMLNKLARKRTFRNWEHFKKFHTDRSRSCLVKEIERAIEFTLQETVPLKWLKDWCKEIFVPYQPRMVNDQEKWGYRIGYKEALQDIFAAAEKKVKGD